MIWFITFYVVFILFYIWVIGRPSALFYYYFCSVFSNIQKTLFLLSLLIVPFWILWWDASYFTDTHASIWRHRLTVFCLSLYHHQETIKKLIPFNELSRHLLCGTVHSCWSQCWWLKTQIVAKRRTILRELKYDDYMEENICVSLMKMKMTICGILVVPDRSICVNCETAFKLQKCLCSMSCEARKVLSLHCDR